MNYLFVRWKKRAHLGQISGYGGLYWPWSGFWSCPIAGRPDANSISSSSCTDVSVAAEAAVETVAAVDRRILQTAAGSPERQVVNRWVAAATAALIAAAVVVARLPRSVAGHGVHWPRAAGARGTTVRIIARIGRALCAVHHRAVTAVIAFPVRSRPFLPEWARGAGRPPSLRSCSSRGRPVQQAPFSHPAELLPRSRWRVRVSSTTVLWCAELVVRFSPYACVRRPRSSGVKCVSFYKTPRRLTAVGQELHSPSHCWKV